MKRFILPLLLALSLLLTGCGKNKAEEDFAAFSERLNHLESLSFTAKVRAEYENKTARFTLSYQEDADGGVVTVLAPELIAGVSAHVRPDGTTLQYDTVVLDTGSLDSLGLSPLSSLPVLLHTMRMGHCDSHWEEDGKTVLQLIPDDDLKCTVWFEKGSMRPLRAELITDGRVTVVVEISDWVETKA
ncbi:MAG: hypothetical protein IJV41_02010 [Oscillospiraceae bacterium]|nr:hypothetical protein [Oscillospiraceae bacterium]